mmetsp:Transcript_6198/g.17778  ORF Transcript_6198/g.17778 Transcript_6198/m.17778 type:complete len:239 (+) Transcript_6198:3099-3815(+)
MTMVFAKSQFWVTSTMMTSIACALDSISPTWSGVRDVAASSPVIGGGGRFMTRFFFRLLATPPYAPTAAMSAGRSSSSSANSTGGEAPSRSACAASSASSISIASPVSLSSMTASASSGCFASSSIGSGHLRLYCELGGCSEAPAELPGDEVKPCQGMWKLAAAAPTSTPPLAALVVGHGACLGSCWLQAFASCANCLAARLIVRSKDGAARELRSDGAVTAPTCNPNCLAHRTQGAD